MNPREIRILFTSVGRRIELMQAFKKAALKRNSKVKIYGVDLSKTAPALFFCDERRTICRITDPDYIPSLLQLCEEEKIDLLIPTIDTDLRLLAQNKERFLKVGTRVCISAEDKIAICGDKRDTADFFEECGLHTPKPVDKVENYHAGFPCFIKPKDGSSSIDAYKVNKEEDLVAFSHKVPDYIIQPFIEGTEYTIDIFCDFEGEPVFIIPRIRMAVRSGEVLRTKIVMDEKMIAESKKLIQRFQPCGPITVQLIQDNQTGDNYYIEINPRFGGGAPLSMKAGADSAEVILRLLEGESTEEILKSEQYPIKDGAIYSRFDQSICVHPGNEKQSLKAVVFDLDDTLYPEKEYVKSGYVAVAAFLKNTQIVQNEEAVSGRLWTLFEEKKPAIDCFLTEAGIFNEHLRDLCIEVYRKHIPKLQLYEGVMECFEKCREQGLKIGIITDGRTDAQWNKIEALGLKRMVDEIWVTDTLGIEFRKPSDIPFRIMQKKLDVDFDKMVYIGDNPNKDVATPIALGMQMVFFQNEEGIYYEGKKVNTTTVKTWKEIIEWISM